MGVAISNSDTKPKDSKSNFEKEPSSIIMSSSELLADDSRNGSPILYEKRRRNTDSQIKKGAGIESFGSRRGIVNILDTPQSFTKNDAPMDENHLSLLYRARSCTESTGTFSPKRKDDENRTVTRTKSLDSILQKSTHPIRGTSKRESFRRFPWANMHYTGQDDSSHQGVSSSMELCTMESDDMFNRVQMLVSRMRINSSEYGATDLCAGSEKC